MINLKTQRDKKARRQRRLHQPVYISKKDAKRIGYHGDRSGIVVAMRRVTKPISTIAHRPNILSRMFSELEDALIAKLYSKS